MKIGHFSKFMELNIHLQLCSKEKNVTSFQFCQNALVFWSGKPFLLYSRCGQISWYVKDIFTKNVGLGTIYNS